MPVLWGLPQHTKRPPKEQIRRCPHPEVQAVWTAMDPESQAIPSWPRIAGRCIDHYSVTAPTKPLSCGNTPIAAQGIVMTGCETEILTQPLCFDEKGAST